MSREISTVDREGFVLAFLRQQGGDGASVKEIWEAANAALGEGLTVQAYYKIADRLVAGGKVDEASAGADGRRYALAQHLHADTALTLDDINDALEALGTTEVLARVLEARRYYEERRPDALARAARALMDEDPIELVEAWVLHMIRVAEADLDMWHDEGAPGSYPLRNPALEHRLNDELYQLRWLVYAMLGLSHEAINVSKPDKVMLGTATLTYDPTVLHDELSHRIFGAKAVSRIELGGSRAESMFSAIVAGSDGSTHASVLQLQSAPSFQDDIGNQVVTINNSVVFLAPPKIGKLPTDNAYHTIPITRSALDDPGNNGMVMAPVMYPYLQPSEYEHMTKCATDVVQWRADSTVFLGTGRSLDGKLLPKPAVHIRDGTITLQEREYQHYSRLNEYGEMVREGFAHTRKILQRIRDSETAVFGGAVKSTQMRFFSGLLNWYIPTGSRKGDRGPIDPGWDNVRAAHIADNEAMSLLLSTLDTGPERDGVYVSFALRRPFHALTTEFYSIPDVAEFDWPAFFEKKRAQHLRDYEGGSVSELPILATSVDVADDNFVYLCSHADYVSFYIGHTAGEPPPMAPRYEFLDSCRGETDAVREKKRIEDKMAIMAQAIALTGLSADRDHNFLTRKSLVKVIPFVVFNAHEICKAMGRKLDAELQSMVVAALKTRMDARRLRASDIKLVPMSISAFVEKWRRALESKDSAPRGDR